MVATGDSAALENRRYVVTQTQTPPPGLSSSFPPSQPPCAVPKARHTPPLLSLSPRMDAVGCGYVLRAQGGSPPPPPSLPPPPHAAPSCLLSPGVESHQPAQ
ncbi:homeobox protein Hox-B4-like [Sander lucioperca]|uniref:homeobox protein Hox-B4-like n=1 Tax=Sander lucioperca TaxID=283035 RepID=UPI00125D864D|nr:homeobox protein Hox-B4-like [Sander lucioperca]